MPKYYVVWHGVKPGVYTTWIECEQQVKGVPGARFKSYKTEAEAHKAYENPPAVLQSCVAVKPKKKNGAGEQRDLPANPPEDRHDTVLSLPAEVVSDAWAVDAACSGNPGPMEYRGVDLATGAEVFRFGPVRGTNNIGEFLAIVHAMALMKRSGILKTIYSDSRNALLWIKLGHCRTKLKRDSRTEKLFDLIARGESWLHEHDWSEIPLLKWNTDRWGEIPADFGRK